MLYVRYKYSEYNLRTCLWNVSHFSTSIPCALITPTNRGHTFSGVGGIYHFPNRCLLNNSSWNPVQLWENIGNICVCPMCDRTLVPNLTPNCVEPLWSHNITRFDLTIDNKIPAPSTKLTCLILLDFLLFVWSDFSFILSPLALCGQRYFTSTKLNTIIAFVAERNSSRSYIWVLHNFLWLINRESPDCVRV